MPARLTRLAPARPTVTRSPRRPAAAGRLVWVGLMTRVAVLAGLTMRAWLPARAPASGSSPGRAATRRAAGGA